MARKILWTESFEGDLTKRGYDTGTVPPTSLAYGLHGKGARLGDDHADDLEFAIDNDSATLYVGANFYFTINVGGDRLIKFYELGDHLGSLNYDVPSERFYVTDADNVLVPGSYVNAPREVWHHAEIKVNFGDPGSCEFRLNGGAGLVLTGIDFLDTGVGVVDRIEVAGTGSSDFDECYIDDLVVYSGAIGDDDFIGPCKILYQSVDGNGNSSDLVGSDGNSIDNYALVDELPINTAEYVESDVEGDKDTYSVENLDSADYNIIGIMAHTYAQRNDPNVKSMRLVARTGAADYAGDTFLLGEAWEAYRQGWDQNPNTLADWTATEINALEVGPEVRDS